MARPFSSTSRERQTAAEGSADDGGGRGLFGFLARGATAAEVGDVAWLQAMLDFEAGLARAEARAGVVPARAAEAIGRACTAERFDPDALGREAARTGNPAAPLVAALTSAVSSFDAEAAGYVHLGATSQDVLDTASMLVVRRATAPLLADLRGAADAAARLAAAHRSTVMLGRTLLQAALPTTFGALAAGWLSGLDRATARLDAALAESLAVELGGAVGTLAALGDSGEEVLEFLAEELGLPEPVVPWHTERTRIADLGTALAEVAGAAANVALDVVLLSQTELGEVREGAPGRGGSSTLPQKRNPVAAVAVRACAARAPGLAATLLATMPQELERAAGPWHAEWQTLSELLVAAGSAAAWLRDCLEHLEVDAARMRSNLAAAGGLPLAERVTTALAPGLGRLAAHRLVEEAARESVAGGGPFGDVLSESPEIRAHLDRDEIAVLLTPAGYLGAAGSFVDRALAAHATAEHESSQAMKKAEA